MPKGRGPEPDDPKPPPTADFGLTHDAWGRLVLIDAEGRRHVGVEPLRAFPLTDPDRWIVLIDAEGRELACVEDPAALPPPVRSVLMDELARREFIPVIRRIVRTSSESLPADWEVETDRGPTRFTLNSADDLRRIGPERVLIHDAQGLRFLVPTLKSLDAASRRLLERHLA